MKIMGLEAPDLLLVLLVAAVMNLFFGQTSLILPAVFGLPSVLLIALYFGKKGRPESHLIHFAKYHTNSGFYSAGEKGVKTEKMKRKFYE